MSDRFLNMPLIIIFSFSGISAIVQMTANINVLVNLHLKKTEIIKIVGVIEVTPKNPLRKRFHYRKLYENGKSE